MYQSVYFIGIIMLGFIWLAFFFLRKDLRKQQLTMSILTTPLAPISQLLWFSKDYWNPKYLLLISDIPIGIEEPLFAFFVGGIGTILYEIMRKRSHQKEKIRSFLTLFLLLITVGLFLFLKSININTIWASIVALLIGGLLMVIIDRDLIWDAIFSGIFFTLIAFIIYIFLLILYPYPDLSAQMWIREGLSGINIFTIPIEEFIWFFSWGIFSGVIYEFWINVKSYKKLKLKINLS